MPHLEKMRSNFAAVIICSGKKKKKKEFFYQKGPLSGEHPPRAAGGLGVLGTCLSELGRWEKGAASTEGWAHTGGDARDRGCGGQQQGRSEREGGREGGDSPQGHRPQKRPRELDPTADASNSFPGKGTT